MALSWSLSSGVSGGMGPRSFWATSEFQGKPVYEVSKTQQIFPWTVSPRMLCFRSTRSRESRLEANTASWSDMMSSLRTTLKLRHCIEIRVAFRWTFVTVWAIMLLGQNGWRCNCRSAATACPLAVFPYLMLKGCPSTLNVQFQSFPVFSCASATFSGPRWFL